MTTKNHITWTATSLGAGFGATFVQRLDPLGGWFDIAKSVVEATAAFDDYEARRGVSEQYRVVVQSNLGVRSVPGAAVASTVAVATNADTYPFEITSNEVPALYQQFPMDNGIDVSLPEATKAAAGIGRYGQRLFRSTDKMGEEWKVGLDLLGTTGPVMWRSMVTALRNPLLSYVCLLDRWGNRMFVGFQPRQAKAPLLTQHAHLALDAVEVTDTPTVVAF